MLAMHKMFRHPSDAIDEASDALEYAARAAARRPAA
jgi:hypothetical protein